MDIQGTYTLPASPTEVWHYLLDTQLLQQTVPGIEHLEQVSENTYAIAINIKLAPLEGTYQGYVTLSEQHYPCSYCLSFEGEGEYGAISGNGCVHLNEHHGATVIGYKGMLMYGGHEMPIPPKLVKGAVKLIIQQFFTTLATQLPTKEHRRVINTESLEEIYSNGRVRGKIVFPVPHTTPISATKSFFSKIVHRFELGAGDYEREKHWERLLRNGGMLLGFLLLVWIGTRLPRRKQG
jgi:carbon monoxide dehydrogenase subunit G